MLLNTSLYLSKMDKVIVQNTASLNDKNGSHRAPLYKNYYQLHVCPHVLHQSQLAWTYIVQ